MLKRLLSGLLKVARPRLAARDTDDVSVGVEAAAAGDLSRARALVARGNTAAARDLLERRLAQRRDDPDARTLLAWVLYEQGAEPAARNALDELLALHPEHAGALNALGVIEAGAGRVDAAVACLRRALAAAPEDDAARYNLAQQLFFSGVYAEGFDLFRARHRLRDPGENSLAPLTLWMGESLAGKSVFVWCDWGGLGDHIQFVRYVRELREQAQPLRVIVGADAACTRLFTRAAAVDEVAPPGVVPAADVHCPLLDLPHWLGAASGALPSIPAYLSADPGLAAAWRARLALPSGVMRIGVMWGNDQRGADTAHGRTRLAKSIPAGQFGVLGRLDATFVNLMPGASRAELASSRLPLIDAGSLVCDFADTAAVIENLDAVVSIDTAVAHLAAAMGKPVLLLLRSEGGMFWPRSGDASAWYPTLRILRQQQAGEWAPVMERALAQLRGMQGGN